uniref:Rhomboid family intramembrane serine protease n=1 Tax=candidate division WOR-3 bacterium TaxID=2052148 RepID=A0A7C3N8T7_UNCW3
MYFDPYREERRIVPTLIFINIVVFIIQNIFSDFFIYYFSLIPIFVTKKFFLWQFFTHMFLHGNFFHLFFNMFSLFIFGINLESVWGSKKFLSYYIVSGLGGGILHYIINPYSPIPSIGASGAIYGVLLAYGLTFPESILYINFFIPVKAKYAVLIFGVMELVFGITGTASGIAHFAHLGGLLSGLLYLKLERFISKNISGIKKMRVYKNFEDMENDRKRERLNELLDKISLSGYNSLTEMEKFELDDLSRWFRDKE